MNSEFMQNYLMTASDIIGRSVTSIAGCLILVVTTLIAAQIFYMAANSVSNGNAEFLRSLLLCGLTLLLAPLTLMGLESLAAQQDISLPSWAFSLGALLLPALIVTSVLTAKSFRCSVLSGVIPGIPAMILWVLLIILLNQVADTIQSGSEKAKSIQERAQELDQIIND